MSDRHNLSPSGRYTLVISSIETKPGCWNYTLGKVFAVGSDTPIAEIRRNYSSFPFTWVEGHANGHDYLVGGADYQGQTVVELDTGKRKDFLPPEAKQGHGFCWAGSVYDVASKLLIVEGCIWAAPYEYRFYDFSDPMNGWPQVGAEHCFDASDKAPTISSEVVITIYETGTTPESDDDSEDEPKGEVVAYKTFKRDGLQLVELSSWIDEAEVARRAVAKERQEKWEREWAEYKKTDTLFLCAAEWANKPPFDTSSKDYSVSTGQCYDGWHPTEKFEDSRVCRRLLERPRDSSGRMLDKGWTVNLDWGRTHAPVKLDMYRDGETFDLSTMAPTKERKGALTARFFEHSVHGINQAVELALEVMKGK